MSPEEFFTRPLYGRIAELERLLRESPTYLVVKNSPEVMTMMGHGDRVMALEVKRLRDALEKIANGEVADKDVGAFAWATLDP